MLRLDIPGPAANETKYLPKENDTVLPHMIMTESQADHDQYSILKLREIIANTRQYILWRSAAHNRGT